MLPRQCMPIRSPARSRSATPVTNDLNVETFPRNMHIWNRVGEKLHSGFTGQRAFLRKAKHRGFLRLQQRDESFHAVPPYM